MAKAVLISIRPEWAEKILLERRHRKLGRHGLVWKCRLSATSTTRKVQ